MCIGIWELSTTPTENSMRMVLGPMEISLALTGLTVHEHLPKEAYVMDSGATTTMLMMRSSPSPIYEWKHCEGMEVGETYEVHWPHSPLVPVELSTNQYQTPFYDGVFCNLPMEAFVTLGAQDIASAVGVHGRSSLLS